MTKRPKPDTRLRTRRIPFPRRILIAPKDGSERRTEDVFDLSLGGMFVSTFLPLEPGQVFDFEMQISGMKFPGTARVVWTRPIAGGDDEPAGMAAVFLDLTTAQKRLLHHEIIEYTRAGGELRLGRPPSATAGPAASAAPEDRTSDSTVRALWSRVASILGRS